MGGGLESRCNRSQRLSSPPPIQKLGAVVFRENGFLYSFNKRLCGIVGRFGLTWRRETLLVL